MTGLEAINAHDGWAITILGMSIVYTGLVVLATAIAQLHKLLVLWDRRREVLRPLIHKFTGKRIRGPGDIVLSPDSWEIAYQFKLLVTLMGQESFPLPLLLALAETRGMGRPHASLLRMIEAKVIVPNGDGYFRWNQDVVL